MEQKEFRFVNALPDSDGVAVTVRQYARLDMDGDTIPEIVLWLQRGEDPYQLGSIILHYQNGQVWGYPMGYRALMLETLKQDGTFQWSNSAFEWGFAKMDFYSGEGERFTWCEGRGSAGEKYFMNGMETSAEVFEAESRFIQDSEWDAIWYTLSGTAPERLRQSIPAAEGDWLSIVKPEQEELQRLVELSSHPDLDMEGMRSFSVEEIEALGHKMTSKFAEGCDFAPIRNAPSSKEELWSQLSDQFMPHLAEREYRFAMEPRPALCLFADGKMWHRVTGWNADVWWEYDWDTFKVLDSGEDFVTYEISGYRKDNPETLQAIQRTLQRAVDGQWKYSERD